MRIPLTRYGARELVLFGGGAAAATAACVALGSPFWFFAPLFGLLCLFVLYFFRDPPRRIPDEEGTVVSPADGKIFAVTEVENEEFIGGPAVRIDIFLAVYNVHVNRAPLAGAVDYVAHRSGGVLNALKLIAGEKNEARSVGFVAEDGGFRFLVRQIVGAIARRIVTGVKPGDRVAKGERFGMLKFGSRTQLSIPRSVPFTVRVKVGDRVKAGLSVLGVVRPGGDA